MESGLGRTTFKSNLHEWTCTTVTYHRSISACSSTSSSSLTAASRRPATDRPERHDGVVNERETTTSTLRLETPEPTGHPFMPSNRISSESAPLNPIFVVTATVVAFCLVGFPWRALGRRLRVPPAVSLMILGALIGTSGLDLLPDVYAAHAGRLSKGAFVVLLLRAGLALDPRTLRAIFLPALAFGLVPVAFELVAVAGLSRAWLFGDMSIAILAGFLVAAVSPAVVLPTMLAVKEQGLGAARFVPDRIMGQTVVNALVAQVGILTLLDVVSPPPGSEASWDRLLFLPLALAAGIAIGCTVGFMTRVDALVRRPKPSAHHAAATILVVVGLVVYFGVSAFKLESVFATLAIGIMVRRRLGGDDVVPLRDDLKRLWLVAEVILFVNLGAAVDLSKLRGADILIAILVIEAIALSVRLASVVLIARWTCLVASERRYLAMSHVPKATIQAVFGTLPLLTFRDHGQAHFEGDGQTLLIMAVLAIVATAPAGAVLLERTARRLLGPPSKSSAG